jgi:hypothetical protein
MTNLYTGLRHFNVTILIMKKEIKNVALIRET